MTDTESLALFGGLVGGALVIACLFVAIFYILLVIAMWKIFTKAGQAGWKSLIPIYNVYVLCKIVGINFWIWMLLLPIIIGFVAGLIFGDNQQAVNNVTTIYGIVTDIYLAIKLGKAFNKGTGFIIGLVIFPSIFELILGFGQSEYVGIENK